MTVPSTGMGHAARLYAIVERALWASLDVLFPPRCQSCRREGERLCARCRADVEYIVEPFCPRCGYPKSAPTTDECDQCRRVLFAGDGIRSLAFHAGPLRQAVHGLKYRHNPPLAEALAGLMAERWPAALPAHAALVPVPLSDDRLRERGFNQAELLARHLGYARRQPMLNKAVRRARSTKPQVGLAAQERRANIAGAFAADPAEVGNADLILIDDVCTTGATLGACAEALLQSGARRVWAYTLGRARLGTADRD